MITTPRPAHLTLWTAALLLLASASAASAQEASTQTEREGDGEAFAFGNSAEFFLLGGLTGGGSFGSAAGGYAGGELSGVWLKEGLWGGFYADTVYDFGRGSTAITVGPEFGLAVLGFDGGVGFRFGEEDEAELGYQGRGMVTLGNFAIYGRYGFWPDSDDAKHIGQVGVLLKMPLWNATGPDPIAP